MVYGKHSLGLGLGGAFFSTVLLACGDDGSSATDASTSTVTMTTAPSSSSTDPSTDPGTSTGNSPTTGGNSNSDGSSSTGTSAGTTQVEDSTAADTTQGNIGTSTGTTGTTSEDDTGIKFDVMPETSSSTGEPPPPMKGSCRLSEIYGAAGGFPKFTDPNYASFLEKKIAIVTTNQQEPPNNHVVHIVRIDGAPPPPALNYAAPKYRHPSWVQQNLGKVFGLTLDSAGNIYVAATTVYGGNPWPNKIRKIDGVTGAISDFATLPNNGPAFGNLNYDCISESIYVSNHEDGRIYQLDMMGQTISTYRHSDKTITNGPANDPGEPNGAFTPLGDTRVWAVQSHAGRLYYSIWREDTGRQNAVGSNEIWSVAYADEGGVPDPATAKKEFDAPNNQNSSFSNPVSDLSFAATGWMLISQRTMLGDAQSTAHQSYTYEYQFNVNNQTWEPKGMTYVVGELAGSAAGGVDHDFEPDGYVWMTGDALDFYTPQVVYGLQGTPHGGGTFQISTIIDMDDELTDQDKTEQGDVELPIPGDADPVPPPQ
ncbi:MAG: hypothetical protein H0T76_11920 [Nannocystis sp.]|nr:hypothetical protein [Nannocystis sp.]MBA3547184.1 hypothetical protein [Nannocystis sp.]